jgi:hypothetical protein
MLKKIPRREAAPPDSNAISATEYRAFLVKNGKRFIHEQFIIELAKMAKIPDSKASKFKISEVLDGWFGFISGNINRSAEIDVLNKMINAANVLHRLLQTDEDKYRRRISARNPRRANEIMQKFARLRLLRSPRTAMQVQKMLRPFEKDDLLFSIRVALNGLPLAHGLDCKVDIPGLLERLIVLIKVAKEVRKAATGVERGAPKGSRGYPGLYWLVCLLERSAYAAGGKFTVNKRDKKGSLLDALDLLRAQLLACPELKPLADLIPLPNQHPVATYRRAINDVRRRPSTGAQRWSAWHTFV